MLASLLPNEEEFDEVKSITIKKKKELWNI